MVLGNLTHTASASRPFISQRRLSSSLVLKTFKILRKYVNKSSLHKHFVCVPPLFPYLEQSTPIQSSPSLRPSSPVPVYAHPVQSQSKSIQSSPVQSQSTPIQSSPSLRPSSPDPVYAHPVQTQSTPTQSSPVLIYAHPVQSSPSLHPPSPVYAHSYTRECPRFGPPNHLGI